MTTPFRTANPLASPAVWLGLVLLYAFRGFLSWKLPITGDEAYFYWWGVRPDWGFYDHPPMVGWWIALLLKISHAEWAIRLPALLLPIPVAACAWVLARSAGEERAGYAALFTLLMPASVVNVLITTDIPLIFWSVLSVTAYVTGLRRQCLASHAAAGLFLALAFLSKYFAVLLGVAYVIHTVAVRRDEKRWSGLFLLVLFALPGPVLNIWYNQGHGWANVMFNAFNRHEGNNSGISWQHPVTYAVTLLYVLTPFLIAFLWRDTRAVLEAGRRDAGVRALYWLALIPFVLFGLMSVGKTIGLHWLLSFAPLLAVAAACGLPDGRLPRLSRWLAGFALVHMVVLGVVVEAPISWWKSTKWYDGVVLTVKSQELLAELKPYEADYVFASDGYSNAVTLGYDAQRYFIVFGPGSSHARHDDIYTDFRELDGKNILTVRKSEPNLDDYRPYFRRVEVKTVDIEGVTFYLVLGQGFRYEPYRDTVLRQIKDRWYRVPAYLPMSACYFADKYFPGETCR